MPELEKYKGPHQGVEIVDMITPVAADNDADTSPLKSILKRWKRAKK